MWWAWGLKAGRGLTAEVCAWSCPHPRTVTEVELLVDWKASQAGWKAGWLAGRLAGWLAGRLARLGGRLTSLGVVVALNH